MYDIPVGGQQRVTAVGPADAAGGPVTSTSQDEGPTSSFSASSTCVGAMSSKRPRSVELSWLETGIISTSGVPYSLTASPRRHTQFHRIQSIIVS